MQGVLSALHLKKKFEILVDVILALARGSSQPAIAASDGWAKKLFLCIENMRIFYIEAGSPRKREDASMINRGKKIAKIKIHDSRCLK